MGKVLKRELATYSKQRKNILLNPRKYSKKESIANAESIRKNNRQGIIVSNIESVAET